MPTDRELALKSPRYRRRILQAIKHAGAGHTGGSLSCVDILNVLYNRVLKVAPATFSDPHRDRYVHSKGHSVEALYVVLADRGFFPVSDLETLGRHRSPFVGHPTRKVPGIEHNTGALGHGLSFSVGLALGAKMDRAGFRVFTLLGDGWWSGYVGWQKTRGRYGSLENSLLVQLEIELASGRRLTVVTDDSWRCNTGPIFSSDFMMGEVYDARRERTGWDRAGYDDGRWLPAREVAPPAVPLVAQRSPPVRGIQTLTPVSRTWIRPGCFIFDLGQNIAGWVRLRLRSRAGTRVTLRHVCRGRGEEVWEPRFTFHGFQYVELTGLPTVPSRSAVTGCIIHSALPPAGRFECSHPGVNRLWRNGRWSQRGNFLSVPIDCPQRDERLGWHVAGIELDPDGSGFQRFPLRPYPGGGLSFARASHQSMQDEIASAWEHSGKAFRWQIRIPANTLARVCVPREAGTVVAESGTPVQRSTSLRVIGREHRFLVCEAGAGAYVFESTWRD